MTELAPPQISSLMEALPGIAAVLRSPTANAIVSLSRAGAGLEEFKLAEAEELLRYGVRRNLLTPEEVERVIQEIKDELAGKPRPVPPPKPPPVTEVAPVIHRPPTPMRPGARTPIKLAKRMPPKAPPPPAKKPAPKPVVAKKVAPKPAAKKAAPKKPKR